MSSIQSVRVRSQRGAAAAVERARLKVVAPRPSSAPRAPFAVLVFVILGVGVVGLLMFNTQMQQASIHATALQVKVDRLEAKSQAMNLELERKRDPQQVAEAARRLGMVAPPVPAMVDLADGTVVGTPTAATAADGTQVRPPKARLPKVLNRKPIIQFVTAKPPAAATTQTASGNGAASATNGTRAGTNETQNQPSQGAPR
ncbi:MAG: hypothetical protein NTV23_14955 [Propionibacteriales bacterium]|nr:hypothetical protein [Propionibacteriales bacterium]